MTYEIHEPSEIDVEQQLAPESDVAHLAKHLTDGDLLDVADFRHDGTPNNAAARELQRRWKERARASSFPVVRNDRLAFEPQKETCA